MAKTESVKKAVRQARYYVESSDWKGVHAVYRGRKNRTGVECVVVVVEKKLPESELGAFILPKSLFMDEGEEVLFDVEANPKYEAQLSPRGRHRPAPGGVSYGHFNITAGTLGGWVHRTGMGDDWFVLTNAHVGADINEGEFGDINLQPGRADGGRNPGDQLGRLAARVHIHMGDRAPIGNPCGDAPPPGNSGKKGNKGASMAWRAWKYPANRIAKVLGCPYRLLVVNVEKRRSFSLEGCLEQPWPNEMDASLEGPVAASLVDPTIHGLSLRPTIVRDPILMELVEKFGRTTEHTSGQVIGLNAAVQIGYGDGNFALFDDQIIIEGRGPDFSAGGDSGSWVIDGDGIAVIGLLFAGGGGQTIANRMTTVFSALSLTL